MLDAHPLNVLRGVDETFNLASTARYLPMSQSTVSQHIQFPEHHFGQPLFIPHLLPRFHRQLAMVKISFMLRPRRKCFICLKMARFIFPSLEGVIGTDLSLRVEVNRPQVG